MRLVARFIMHVNIVEVLYQGGVYMQGAIKPYVGQEKKIYFAHPINTYHTALEDECLEFIRGTFHEHAIVNPSDESHRSIVSEMKRHDPNANVMGYFEKLVISCDIVLVLPFPDGKWGAGVYREAEIALERHKEVWNIEPRTKFISLVTRLFPGDALSVEETRARVYNLPERTIRPYT